MIKRCIIPVLPLLLLPAFGCSGSGKGTVASVSGKITYQNQPVTAGTVYFYPADGTVVQAGIGSDGTYIITDVPAGDYTVAVETASAKSKTLPSYGGRGGKDGGRGGMSPIPEGAAGTGGAYVKVPDKYSKKETSGLKTTLSKGKNTYDIPLAD